MSRTAAERAASPRRSSAVQRSASSALPPHVPPCTGGYLSRRSGEASFQARTARANISPSKAVGSPQGNFGSESRGDNSRSVLSISPDWNPIQASMYRETLAASGLPAPAAERYRAAAPAV